MITKWTVANFKSIAKETTLDLAPLTIFAGANSSGKSAFLQTILMISQTLAHEETSRPILLNGPLVKLGAFNDVKSENCSSEQVVIGWEYRHGARKLSDEESAESIALRLSFMRRGDGETGQRERVPRLFRVELSARLDRWVPAAKDSGAERAVCCTVAGDDWGPNYGDTFIPSPTTHNVSLDDASMAALASAHPGATPHWCALDHFIPAQCSLRVKFAEEAAWIISRELTGEKPALSEHGEHDFSLAYAFGAFRLPGEIVQMLERLAGTDLGPPPTHFDEDTPPQTRYLLHVLNREIGSEKLQQLHKKFMECRDLRGLCAEMFRSYLRKRREALAAGGASLLAYRLTGEPVVPEHLPGESLEGLNVPSLEGLHVPAEVADMLETRAGADLAPLFKRTPGAHTNVRALLCDNPPRDKLERIHAIFRAWPDLRKSCTEQLLGIYNSRGYGEFAFFPFEVPWLKAASARLKKALTKNLRYLGPLREAPKPIYPQAAYAVETDVGVHGERTAEVLASHRQREVGYIRPGAFEGRPPFNLKEESISLGQAVNEWLHYLGLGDAAQGCERGDLGHDLKIIVGGGRPRDLTQVGMGVSQVLPILVMALLAQSGGFWGDGDILIFEQPELHLHPKVQSRLGDFFLSMSLLGKQCLIETHSEHLINRLRYRAAAEENTTKIIDNLKIYFVEKKDGESQFREVKVNQYGAILDWPEGFFDQGPHDAQAILRAAIAKSSHGKGE